MSSATRVGAIAVHQFRLIRRDPLSVMVLIVFPVITIAFLKPAFRPALVASGHPHANGAEQVVPGQTVMSAFFLVALITLTFFAEHGWATWDRLRASRASSFEIVTGKALPHVAIGVTQFVVVMGAGVLLFGLHIRGDAIALVPLTLTFTLCLVLLGVAVTAVCRTAQQANSFAYLGMVLFGAIGGAFVPFSVLPGWAQTVAPATPTYWAMRGMRSVVLDGHGLGAVALPSAVLLGMTALFAFVAVTRLRFDDAKVAWA
ncbi:MAG TPA: ABC transporter permease [Acidimicrobiia bacterium]|jgi:ABC-2 type transport system permease protein